MLIISKSNGVYKLTVGTQVMGQARSLESLLKKVDKDSLPDSYYFSAAEMLDPLIQEQGGQISTGGVTG